jgi:uncharacterized RDD family membrane protein YckC
MWWSVLTYGISIAVLGAAVFQTVRALGARGETTTGTTDVIGRRVAAHLLDWFAVGLIWMAVLFLGEGLAAAFNVAPTTFRETFQNPWYSAGVAALAVFDFILVPAATGCTLGKQMLGIRVVDGSGRRPRLRATVIRTIPLAFEQLGVVALWAMSRHPKHQRFGDRWAHTYVVGRERPAPSLRPKPRLTFRRDDPRRYWA